MNRKEELLSLFESKYFNEKKHHFYKPKHREFLYDTIINGIYNTDLVLCINGIKPVSRFVANKIEHIEFLKKFLKEKGLFLEYRELKDNENDENIYKEINFIVYIGKDKENLKKALIFDESGEGDIGELLGYPDCCSKKWKISSINKELSHYFYDTNDFFKSYLDSPKYPILNNPFFNFTSNSLSFFYPCSLNCENALKLHENYSKIIKSDNEAFYKNIISYFSLPILFLFPKEDYILTPTLHFDEVFRIYFIGVKKGEIIHYKDFFIVSYAFLDQEDDEYKEDSFELLEKLILGNKVYIEDDNIIIEGKNNYKNIHKIKSFAKIINFS